MEVENNFRNEENEHHWSPASSQSEDNENDRETEGNLVNRFLNVGRTTATNVTFDQSLENERIPGEHDTNGMSIPSAQKLCAFE